MSTSKLDVEPPTQHDDIKKINSLELLPPPQPAETPRISWRKRAEDVQAVVVKHYLPIAFAVSIVFALAWPAPGRALLHVVILGDVRIIQELAMGLVFFISGLTLNTDDVKKARGRHIFGVLYGFITTLFITPLLGFVMRSIPLEPELFTIGLALFCVVPTTLGVGVALVRSCKGNEGIALLLTVGTNLLGVVTMPFMLKFIFLNYDLEQLKIKVDLLNLFTKLVITIFAPSVVGKLLRDLVKPAEAFAKKYRTPLSITSTTSLAFIIWQTLSGSRKNLFSSNGGMVVIVIVLGCATHVFYLLCNWIVVRLVFRMPAEEAIAVIICSSQKSAPVAVTVISYITTDPSAQGLLAIPAIVGQLAQIFIGAAIASPIATRVVAEVAATKAAAEAAEAVAAAAAAAEPAVALSIDPADGVSAVNPLHADQQNGSQLLTATPAGAKAGDGSVGRSGSQAGEVASPDGGSETADNRAQAAPGTQWTKATAASVAAGSVQLQQQQSGGGSGAPHAAVSNNANMPKV